MKVGLLSMALLLNCPAFSQEQDVDSLCMVVKSDTVADTTHSLKLKDVLIPTAVVGATSAFVGSPWLTRQREHVQDALSARGKHKFKVDEYSQYAPMVAVYGLDLCGVKAKHRFVDRTVLLAMSYATMGILVNTMKYTFKEKRPDSNARNSYPSGHTATAFMGAEFLWKEYKDVSPWIGYAGYAVAAATGYLRIYNDRHYINDVVAGACIGMLSVKMSYWLYPKFFKRSRCSKSMDVVALPYYSAEGCGVNMCLQF
ncbi:phosphatase PAP2 family protein [Prevotella sp. PINT]|nr:phosphatase PAP2 family protein [Palleniella intestinalis]